MWEKSFEMKTIPDFSVSPAEAKGGHFRVYGIVSR